MKLSSLGLRQLGFTMLLVGLPLLSVSSCAKKTATSDQAQATRAITQPGPIGVLPAAAETQAKSEPTGNGATTTGIPASAGKTTGTKILDQLENPWVVGIVFLGALAGLAGASILFLHSRKLGKLSNGIKKVVKTAAELNRADLGHAQSISSLGMRLSELQRMCHSTQASLDDYSNELKSLSAQINPPTPIASASATTPASELPPAPSIDDYIDYVNRGDRASLRAITISELNLTAESEEAIQRGKPGVSTNLASVIGGGSFCLVECAGSHWILPSIQNLASMTTIQPEKGVYSYEHRSVSRAELQKAAKATAVGGYWQITSLGLVLVPA